jgi:hypothetical protein
MKVELPVLRHEAWPAIAGRPGLVQGRYGAAGNLELVVPDPEDGRWVAWFNADQNDAHAGAAVREWSGGLRFATGRQYLAASIAQVEPGPNALEVLGVTAEHDLVRHVWRAATGFVEIGSLASGVSHASAMVSASGGAALYWAAGHLLGQMTTWKSTTLKYPILRPLRQSRPEPADDTDASWHTDHLDVLRVIAGHVRLDCLSGTRDVGPGVAARLVVDPNGKRLVALLSADGEASLTYPDDFDSHPLPLGPADDLALAAVHLDGKPEIDVVLRRGDSLQHLRVPAVGLAGVTSREVSAVAWAEAAVDSVHRW